MSLCVCVCMCCVLIQMQGIVKVLFKYCDLVTWQFVLKEEKMGYFFPAVQQQDILKPKVFYLSSLFEKMSPATDRSTKLDIGKSWSLEFQLTNVSLLFARYV